MARDEGGDVVVGGVAPCAAGEAHRDPRAAAGIVGAAVEDDRDGLVARVSKRFQALDEPPLRAAPVAPPTVRPRAHDVVAVDDPLGHEQNLRAAEGRTDRVAAERTPPGASEPSRERHDLLVASGP